MNVCRVLLQKIIVVATAAGVAACTGSLLETKLPVPTVYVLSASPAENAAESSVPIDVAVASPTAVPGLDTDRIAVLHEARRLDYYRDAQWGAALPQVVQSLLVGSLRNQKLFRGVTAEQARISASYLLDVEVRDFQAEYQNDQAAPVVRVSLTGSLIRISDRKLIGILPATTTVPASANRQSAVVEAFESAARQTALAIGKAAFAAVRSAPPAQESSAR